MTTQHLTPPPERSLEGVLMDLLLRQRRDKLPTMHRQLQILDGAAPHVRFRVNSYADVVAWSLNLGGPAEPDRHIVGAEGITYYDVHIPQAIGGWAVEVEARITLPISIPCNEDMVDALEIAALAPSAEDPALLEAMQRAADIRPAVTL